MLSIYLSHDIFSRFVSRSGMMDGGGWNMKMSVKNLKKFRQLKKVKKSQFKQLQHVLFRMKDHFDYIGLSSSTYGIKYCKFVTPNVFKKNSHRFSPIPVHD